MSYTQTQTATVGVLDSKMTLHVAEGLDLAPVRLRPIETLRPHMFSMRVKLAFPSAGMLALFRSIQVRLGATDRAPVIHFVSPRSGEGADALALETGIAAARSGKSVLFLDTGSGKNASLRDFRDRARQIEGEEGTHHPLPPVLALRGNPFYYTVVPQKSAGTFDQALEGRDALEHYRQIFDMVVVYSENGLSDPLAYNLYGIADGNVLVAEAERSRKPVLRDLRRMVEAQGGRAIGAVLNKRRLYIPRFLYWLFFRG